jgi:cobalamin biosynthesis Mg chelatase CobN
MHTASQPAAGRSQPRTTAGPSGAGAASVVAGLGSGAAGGSGGGLEHATSEPRIVTHSALAALRKTVNMWVILLEAFAALALLVLIVWWTMFSGRRKGERKDE